MNHSYRIVTEVVEKPTSGQRYFVAQLTDVFIEVDGSPVKAPYPNRQVKGQTYAAAMLKANDAFQQWLNHYEYTEV